MALIEIKNLCKTFGSGDGAVHALEDVSLSIEAGEIFGIIGLSGAGKSTLVRCMNLLERPTAGSVTVNGAELCRLTDKELRRARRDIGMIFQSFNLLMQRNALANVRFPLELAGVPKREAGKRAQELLELVGLGDRAGAYPAQLSGGQKQRVAIARALATNPRSCSATRPPAPSTPPPPRASLNCCATSTAASASPSSSSRTRCASSSASAPASPSSRTAA
ncbi:MAG: methionine ABC transporter ATP-binding protein [Lachnospiraceae bacterium]